MTSRRGRGEQQGDSCKDSEQQGAEPLRRESAVEHLARDNEPTVCRGSSTFGVDRELRAASAAPAQRATALRSQRRLMRRVVTRAHITGSAEAKAGVGPPARARGTGASAATRRPRSARSLRRRLAAPAGRSLPRARLCGGSYPAQSQTRGRYRGEGVGASPQRAARVHRMCSKTRHRRERCGGAARQPGGRQLYWGAEDPIGRPATLPFSKTVLRRVVGIVGDVKQRSLVEPSTPTAYFYTREPYGKATFAIRTSAPPVTLARLPLQRSARSIQGSRSEIFGRW